MSDKAVHKGLSMINAISNLREWLHKPYDIPIPASESFCAEIVKQPKRSYKLC